MNNPLAEHVFEEMKRLSRVTDDDLITEYKTARKIAEKTDLPSDWILFETVENEVNRRNRRTGNNSTWSKLKDVGIETE